MYNLRVTNFFCFPLSPPLPFPGQRLRFSSPVSVSSVRPSVQFTTSSHSHTHTHTHIYTHTRTHARTHTQRERERHTHGQRERERKRERERERDRERESKKWRLCSQCRGEVREGGKMVGTRQYNAEAFYIIRRKTGEKKRKIANNDLTTKHTFRFTCTLFFCCFIMEATTGKRTL